MNEVRGAEDLNSGPYFHSKYSYPLNCPPRFNGERMGWIKLEKRENKQGSAIEHDCNPSYVETKRTISAQRLDQAT